MTNTQNSGYLLFLDDLRPVSQMTPRVKKLAQNYQLPIFHAQDFEHFKLTIDQNGVPVYVSFDHDLTPRHYAGDYSDCQTGHHAMLWLLDKCWRKGIPFPGYTVHSLNRPAHSYFHHAFDEYVSRGMRYV